VVRRKITLNASLLIFKEQSQQDLQRTYKEIVLMISLNVCSPTSLLAMHDAGLRANCSCSWANNSPYLLTARGAAGRGSPNNYSRAEEGFDLPPPAALAAGRRAGRAGGHTLLSRWRLDRARR